MRDFHLLSLRRDGHSPTFLASDRSPGIYREFFERWLEMDDRKNVPLRITSSNVHDENPTHGFYETGRRFELFDVVPELFLEDLGIGLMEGMHHINDGTGTVYRFRQV